MDSVIKSENVINVFFVLFLALNEFVHLRFFHGAPGPKQRMFDITVSVDYLQSLFCPVCLCLQRDDLFTILIYGGGLRPNFLRKLFGLVGQLYRTEVHKLVHQLLFFCVKANYCNSLHINN